MKKSCVVMIIMSLTNKRTPPSARLNPDSQMSPTYLCVDLTSMALRPWVQSKLLSYFFPMDFRHILSVSSFVSRHWLNYIENVIITITITSAKNLIITITITFFENCNDYNYNYFQNVMITFELLLNYISIFSIFTILYQIDKLCFET